MTVLPGAGGICRKAARQSRMRGGDYHDGRGVVEKRIVPQREADVDSGQFVELLVKHEDVVAAPPGQLERLLTQSGSRDVVSLLRENALQRSAQPFVAASDQGGWSS